MLKKFPIWGYLVFVVVILLLVVYITINTGVLKSITDRNSTTYDNSEDNFLPIDDPNFENDSIFRKLLPSTKELSNTEAFHAYYETVLKGVPRFSESGSPNYSFGYQDFSSVEGTMVRAYGIEFFGEISEFSADTKMLSLFISNSVLSFDISNVSQLFRLVESCEDLENLCPDLAFPPIEGVGLEEMYPLLRPNYRIRLYVSELPNLGKNPLVSRIIVSNI